jgi:hypothetical protein
MGLFDFFKKNNSSAFVETKQTTTKVAIDYATIDSLAKAKELETSKQLVKHYLFPLELGGQENALNLVYITQVADNAKKIVDAKMDKMLEDGEDIRYAAKPEYIGASFIPSKILVTVTGDKSMVEVIDIW